MDTKLDMNMMYAVHDALRRDLVRIARVTSRMDDDPRRLLQAAVGWQLFKKFLQIHHTSEDVTVWPMVRQEASARPDQLAVVEAMEAEHAKIDPLLAAIDEAVADRDAGYQRLGDLVDALTTDLTAHLVHEESEGLALVDATMTSAQWQHFAEDHRARVGDDARRYLPWLLDSANAERVFAILDKMPEPLIAAYRAEWGPSYERLNLWGTQDEPATT